jgi:hypothetical protein
METGWEAENEDAGDESLPLPALPRRRERPFPAEVRIDTRGIKPKERAGTVHGYHSTDAVEIPTSLTCNLCPLYHVKRKDKRHVLACPEGRKNQICPILTRKQEGWAVSLIDEVRQATGRDPTATDRARIEQVIRYRSRLFQVENYLKVAGLIDLKAGEVRAVADRLGGIESGLTRSLGELRQSMAEARDARRPPAPSLSEYLGLLAQGSERKQILSDGSASEEP